MVVNEDWKEELNLYFWKMMKLESWIVFQGDTSNSQGYRFPNGISIRPSFGNRKNYCWFHIDAHIEYSSQISNILGKIGHKSKVKNNEIKIEGECSRRGELLDLLWDIYSIGRTDEEQPHV